MPAYEEQVRGLIDGGADVILLETIFDTLNAKAGIVAIENVFEERGVRLPLMISVTITDRSGRTLSGQMLDAFYTSIRHARPFSRRHQLRARRARHAAVPRRARAASPTVTSAATRTPGCRMRSASTTKRPDETSQLLLDFVASGFANIVGGCCGTTPDHIAAIVKAVEGGGGRCRRSPGDGEHATAALSERRHYTRFSGLETLTIRPESNFQMIGERTNVTGSAKFARLIKADNYTAAVRSRPSRCAAAPTSSTSTWTRACSTPSRP